MKIKDLLLRIAEADVGTNMEIVVDNGNGHEAVGELSVQQDDQDDSKVVFVLTTE